MKLGLEERVVFVAGSSRGIGRAIARSFLEEGARVVLSGRGGEALDCCARELGTEFGAERILAWRGDLSTAEGALAALEFIGQHWGAIDVLVANIGSGSSVPGWSIGRTEWERVFENNLWPGVSLAEATIGGMVERRCGSIVFIGSITGVESLGAPIAYSVAKAGLAAYAKELARRVGEHEVRVNMVAPGNVLFPGGTWERKLAADRERVMGFVNAEVPLRRFGQPSEVADMVVYLASDRASFVTGACVIVDGGQTRGY